MRKHDRRFSKPAPKKNKPRKTSVVWVIDADNYLIEARDNGGSFDLADFVATLSSKLGWETRVAKAYVNLKMAHMIRRRNSQELLEIIPVDCTEEQAADKLIHEFMRSLTGNKRETLVVMSGDTGFLRTIRDIAPLWRHVVIVTWEALIGYTHCAQPLPKNMYIIAVEDPLRYPEHFHP